MNQMAGEIAREYEALAIRSANEHYQLKRHQPFAEFPALEAHVKFCTGMHEVWRDLALKIEGPHIYGADDDRRDYYGEYGV